MKTILTILISLLLVQNRTTTDSDQTIHITIQQRNIMTGQSVIYSIENDIIEINRVYESRTRTVAKRRLNKENLSSIAQKAYSLFDTLTSDDTIVSNPEILDGYIWSISITRNQKQKELTVYNCNHNQLDFIINMINEDLNKKKRLIFPTSKLYSDSKCQ